MSIVCASDFSAAARSGIRAAAALAARLGETQLSLVHVLDSALAERLDVSQLENLKKGTAQRLAEEGHESCRDFPQVAVQPEVLTGPAADTLNAFAREQRASLLVIASQGHGASPLYRLGGTSERVAVGAAVPLIVVRDAAPFEAWARGERLLRVMIGVDVQARNEPVVQLAKRLRKAGDCELVFGHIYHWHEGNARYGLPRLPNNAAIDPDARVEALLKRDMESQVGAFEGQGAVSFVAKVGFGRLGDHLLELAEAEKADLIAVGTHHQVGARRLASVSSVVLHFGHASVACVPDAARESVASALKPVRRVLIATDLSPFANQAIAHGYSLLAERGGEVQLVYASTLPTRAPHEAHAELVQRLRALVPAWASERGIATRVNVLERSDPARFIIETAQRTAADMICMASHGRSGLMRAVLGSVADQVLRESAVPVLFVRPAQ
jgi:nucleotide-binding universal stress UspA family protein